MTQSGDCLEDKVFCTKCLHKETIVVNEWATEGMGEHYYLCSHPAHSTEKSNATQSWVECPYCDHANSDNRCGLFEYSAMASFDPRALIPVWVVVGIVIVICMEVF